MLRMRSASARADRNNITFIRGRSLVVTPRPHSKAVIMVCGEAVCVTAASTLESIGQRWKPSVRLDDKRASLLRALSAEIGSPPSEVLRRAIDHYAASRSPKPAIQMAPAGVRHLPIASGESPKVSSAASPAPCLTTSVKAAPSPPSTPTDPTTAVPARIAELITQARGFGSQLRRIRREQFQRAFAASAVAAENAENSEDDEVYIEMLRLGRRYRWFE